MVNTSGILDTNLPWHPLPLVENHKLWQICGLTHFQYNSFAFTLLCRQFPETGSAALSKDAFDVSFPVQHSDNLEWRGFGSVDDGVVRIAGQRPETQGASCKIRSGMTAQRAVGKKLASVVNRLFYAVRGIFIVLGNVRPNVKNVSFGKRRKSVSAHCLEERSRCQLSFIA
jgi:hypothetical protein